MNEFSYKDEKTLEGCTGETVMMAPAVGFYSDPEFGKNQMKLIYIFKKEDSQRALFLLAKILKEYEMNINSIRCKYYKNL